MKKSQIFIPNFESPFDRHVKPIYETFTAFKQEIIYNWKTEFIQGMIGQRNFRDLRDVRLDIGRNGDPIIRLKPEIGFDTEAQLSFYMKFFRTYVRLKNEPFILLVDYQITNAYLHQYAGVDSSTLEQLKEDWYTVVRPRARRMIMVIKLLIMAQNFGKLRAEDLPVFDPDTFANDDDFVSAMDDLVREYNMETMEADKFLSPDKHFYDELDHELVHQCVMHAQRIAVDAKHPIVEFVIEGNQARK